MKRFALIIVLSLAGSSREAGIGIGISQPVDARRNTGVGDNAPCSLQLPHKRLFDRDLVPANRCQPGQGGSIWRISALSLEPVSTTATAKRRVLLTP